MRLHQIIEEKEDTAKKLAEANGKPTKNYLFAPEINRIVSIVRSLMSLTMVNDANINAILNQQDSTVDFGEIDVDLIDYVNNNLGVINLTNATFIEYVLSGIRYVTLYVGQDGSFGAGDDILLQDDLIVIYDGSDEINQANERVFLGKLTVFGPEDYELFVDHNTMNDFRYSYVATGRYAIKFPNKTSLKIFPSVTQISSGRIETFVQSYIDNAGTEEEETGVEVLVSVVNNSGFLSDGILNRTIFQIQYYE